MPVDRVETHSARRMPDERRMSTLVRRGADVDQALRDVARQLAVVHEAAGPPPPGLDPNALLLRNWDDNLAALRASEQLDGDAVADVAGLARRYLAGRAPLLAQRARDGFLRDGHGDLLADDVFCLDDGPRVLDCLDFADRYRFGDVLLDAAFLAMDLERLGRADLGDAFLAHYAELSRFGRHPRSLADHYVAYRASVRAKVALVRAVQGVPAQLDEARALLAIARRRLRRARVRLVLVGGLPGTGKSWLSTALSDQHGWVLLRSDEVRKDLHRVGHDTTLPLSAYTAAATTRTYETMLDRAGRALRAGASVILDATWSGRHDRAAARAAADAAHADLHELRCDAPPGVVRERLTRRASRVAAGRHASDADVCVFEAVRQRFAAWPSATTVDTTAPLADVVAGAPSAVEAVVGQPAEAPSRRRS